MAYFAASIGTGCEPGARCCRNSSRDNDTGDACCALGALTGGGPAGRSPGHVMGVETPGAGLVPVVGKAAIGARPAGGEGGGDGGPAVSKPPSAVLGISRSGGTISLPKSCAGGKSSTSPPS